jgi:hypothetical protein
METTTVHSLFRCGYNFFSWRANTLDSRFFIVHRGSLAGHVVLGPLVFPLIPVALLLPNFRNTFSLATTNLSCDFDVDS